MDAFDFRDSPDCEGDATAAFPADRTGISLFSGAGGLDLGLERGAGIEFRAWVEHDASAQATLKANFDVAPVALFGDICDTSPRDLLSAARVEQGEAFIVAGGPPCQAFSTAGRRQSVGDPRGQLVERYFRVIEAVSPRFFVFENVRGLLSAAIKHRPLAERTNGHDPISAEEQLGSVLKERILPEFQRLGYEVVVGLLDAADYGVPQHRFRVIILGSRDHEFGSAEFEAQKHRTMLPTDLAKPTHQNPKSDPGRDFAPWVTLREALSGLPESPCSYQSYSRSRAEVYARIPAGANWRYIRDHADMFPPGFLAKVMGGAFESTGGRVGFWRRLDWDEPCATVVTSPVQKATGLCHPVFVRPLSVQEYKRIQQFPDQFEVCGSVAQQYRQLGNAVPIGLAAAIGRGIEQVATRVNEKAAGLMVGLPN